jgi:hypothetical protein
MQVGITFPNKRQAIITVADGASLPLVGESLHLSGDEGTDWMAHAGIYRVASRLFQLRMGDKLHGPTHYGWTLELEDK